MVFYKFRYRYPILFFGLFFNRPGTGIFLNCPKNSVHQMLETEPPKVTAPGSSKVPRLRNNAVFLKMIFVSVYLNSRQCQ